MKIAPGLWLNFSARGEERERHEDWESRERLRARPRDDPGPRALLDLLELEIANEVLPVPLVFEVEFEPPIVVIDLVLPEVDEVPSTRTSLTKTGKLSEKKMTQRDRRELLNLVRRFLESCRLSQSASHDA